nr:MAG TPA: hypothetical protein [Bacteriophage sp.]
MPSLTPWARAYSLFKQHVLIGLVGLKRSGGTDRL